MNEVVLLLEKFLDDFIDFQQLDRKQIDLWAIQNMTSVYSSKMSMFYTGLSLISDLKPNKIISFNFIKIKKFYESNPKKFEDWITKHCDSNKLNFKEIKIKCGLVK
jgi:hypothetical protein